MFVAYTVPSRQYYADGRHIIETARDFTAQSGVPLCISIDPSLSDWHRIDFRSRLYDQLARSVHPTRPKCVPASIVPVTADMTAPAGMVPVEVEVTSPRGPLPVALFVERQPAVDGFLRGRPLSRVERLLPISFDQRVAEVRPVSETIDIIDTTVGQRTIIHVRVTNGSGTTWLEQGQTYPLRLGIRVRDGVTPLLEDRIALTRALAPGDSEEFAVPIGPVDQPGRYEVTVGVVQERIAWFHGALTFELDVLPDPADVSDRTRE